MASLGDVSRYLRQRRAIGKPITDRDRSAAWSAYFDTEASKQLERSRLALETRRTDIHEQGSLEQQRIAREAQESQEKAAMVGGVVQLGQLGSMAYKGSQTALGQKAIAGVKGLFGSAPAQVGAQGAAAGLGAQGAVASQIAPNTIGAGYSAVTGAGPATSGTISTGGASLGSFAGPSAIGFVAGDIASSAMMRSEKMQKFAEKTSFGILHAKKDASLAAGIGAGAAAGSVFGPVGAAVGAVLGGIAAGIKNTWICTKIKDTIGMTEYEWETIGQFRKYAMENHSDWLGVYVNIGPDLLEAIDGDENFYSALKETFLIPVIKLTEGGFMEAAYLTYKSVVMELIDIYKPELTEEYPEVI